MIAVINSATSKVDSPIVYPPLTQYQLADPRRAIWYALRYGNTRWMPPDACVEKTDNDDPGYGDVIKLVLSVGGHRLAATFHDKTFLADGMFPMTLRDVVDKDTGLPFTTWCSMAPDTGAVFPLLRRPSGVASHGPERRRIDHADLSKGECTDLVSDAARTIWKLYKVLMVGTRKPEVELPSFGPFGPSFGPGFGPFQPQALPSFGPLPLDTSTMKA